MHRTISPILETWCLNWPGRPLLEKLLQNQRPPRPTSPKNAAFSGWAISLRREASPAFGGTSRGSLPGRPDKLLQNLRPLFQRRAEGHPGRDCGAGQAGALHKVTKVPMSQKTSPKTRTIGKSVSEISEESELRPALRASLIKSYPGLSHRGPVSGIVVRRAAPNPRWPRVGIS